MCSQDGPADLLQPVRSELGRVQELLGGLGVEDGQFLHHVLGRLLALPTDLFRPGVVLLVGKAAGGTGGTSLVQFGAAVQIVHAASLAHQIVADIRNETGERDQLRVLAGDYLYAQAALITANLRHFAVMSSLAAAIQTICARDLGGILGGQQGSAIAPSMGMFRLSTLGAGLLSRCSDATLAVLDAYGSALDAVAANVAAPGAAMEAGSLLLPLPESPARRSLMSLAQVMARVPSGRVT